MNKYTLLAVLFIGTCRLSAQCVKNISTNPASPVNAELSTLYPTKTNPWLNTLQWENVIYLNPNAGWQINGWNYSAPLAMFSPFSTAQPSPYDYLRNNQSLNPMQYSWDKGWELLWVNTGYYPNGQAVNTANTNNIPGTDAVSGVTNSRVPYFVLYNRYTGIMRPFVNAFTDLNNFNEIQTKFEYPGSNGNVSGIFRNINGVDQALDQSTIVSKATSYNKNLHNNNYWWSSDIPLSYDPCVCNYATNLDFSLTGFDTLNVSLYGRSLSTTQPLKNSYGLNHQDFLSAANFNDVNALSGGNIMYKSMGKMLDDYNQQLDDYNIAKADYNSFGNTLLRTTINSFKGVISQGISGGVSSFIPTNAVKTFIMNNQLKVERKLMHNDSFKLTKGDTSTAAGWASKLKETTKSELGKQLDNLTMSLASSAFVQPQPPTMPTATFTEMRFSGSIASSSTTFVTNFFTPGTTVTTGTNLTPYVYPAYNNPVGLFALLETPKIGLYQNVKYESKVLSTTEEISNCNGCATTQHCYTDSMRFDADKEIFFKITDPLKYKLNQAAGINNSKSKLYVSFQIELENTGSKELTGIYYAGPSCNNKNSTDFVKKGGNMEMLHGYAASNGTGAHLEYSSAWYPMTDLGETLFGLTVSDASYFAYKYQDGNCQYLNGPQAAGWYPNCLKSADRFFGIKKIKMKIMTDLYFNNTDMNTTNVFTHIIYDPANGIDVIQDKGQYVANKGDIVKYNPGEITLKNVTISPTTPEVTQIVGNVLYVDAEKITLTGTIRVAPGYSAEIRAIEEIVTLSNADIEGNISMYLKQDHYNFAPMVEATPTEVQNFCTGGTKKYQANSLRSAPMVTDKEPAEKIKEVTAVIYPNPTYDVVNVRVNNPEAAKYEFRVYDMTGKVVIDESQRSDANPTFEIDLGSLIKGIYIFELVSGENLLKRDRIVKM